MPQANANFAKAFLAANINASATELTVQSARADLFPLGTTSDWGAEQIWFKLVLQDDFGNYEIVYAGVRTAGSAVLANLLRGREGTTARSWTAASTAVANRPTAEDFARAFSAMADGGSLSTNSADFNLLVLRGSYRLVGDGDWGGATNAPEASPANGMVNVFTSGSTIHQEIMTHTPMQVWRRQRNADSTWTAWTRADAFGATSIGRQVLEAANTAAARTVLGAAALAGSAAQTFSVAPATAPDHAVRNDQLQAVRPVGEVASFMSKTAPAGWVRMLGGTIGSAASGATERANADTQALFTKLWAELDDAVIYTSAGAASTRGASAAADFAANKRMEVPTMQDTFMEGWGNGGGLWPTRKLGEFMDHGLQDHWHIDGREALFSDFGGGIYVGGRTFPHGDQPSVRAAITSGAQGANLAGVTRPRSRAFLICIKL